MTDPFIARSSPGRIVLLAGASLVFVIGGLWMAGVFGEPPPSRRHSEATAVTIGWITTVFFGLTFVAITKQLFGDRELLVLNERGLRSAQWSDDTIPWCEIIDVTTWSHKGSTCIVLHLRDRDLFPGRGLRARLAGANRKLTGGDIAIAMTATDKSIGETLAAIDSFRANAEKQNRS